MRFFKSDSESVYEQARLSLDAAWGLPNGYGTATCIDPASVAPRDANGMILLAVDDAFCEYAEAAEMLPQLLASSAVEEITEAEYRAAMPDPLQG